MTEKDFTIIADILYAKGETLYIEGRCKIDPTPGDIAAVPERYSVVLLDELEVFERAELKRAAALDAFDEDGNVAFPGMVFSVEMPVKAGMHFSFTIRDNETGDEYPATLKMGRYSRLSSARKYYYESDLFIITKKENTIYIHSKRLLRLFSRIKRKRALNQALRKAGRQDILELRNASRKLKGDKPIWLLTDRADRAGDNAEAFFKYLCSNGATEKYRIVFAVNESSPDFARLQQYGEVVPYGSDEYKALFLAADKFISSQWTYTSPTNPTLNPFRKDRKYFKDLIASDFIFLQHGVTMNDLSTYGHKLKRNVKLFITTANKEYDSIVNGEYGYSRDEVVLTGFARHDYLTSEPDKLILFMPTRRTGLERLTKDELKASEYYRFYNGLINDDRLLRVMRENGYRGELVLHPVLINEEVYKAFEANDVISIAEKGDVDYTALNEKGSLLVSDYSSTTVDFAYLHKPVIYAQYDRDSFFSGQIYDPGYFSYEDDGFGPVCYDYETAVSEIIGSIEGGCVMDEVYKKRVDGFFAFNDRENCRRIYEAIEALDKKK